MYNFACDRKLFKISTVGIRYDICLLITDIDREQWLKTHQLTTICTLKWYEILCCNYLLLRQEGKSSSFCFLSIEKIYNLLWKVNIGKILLKMCILSSYNVSVLIRTQSNNLKKNTKKIQLMSKKTERVLEQNLEPGVCSHENWYVNLSFKRQRTKSHFHYLRFDIDLVWWLWIQMVWSKRMPWAPIFSWNVIRASQWENFAPEKLDHKNYLKFLFEFQLKDLLFSSSSPFFFAFCF